MIFVSSFNSARSVSSELETHSSSLILLGLVNLSSHLAASDHFSGSLNQKHYFQFLVCSSKKATKT